MLMFDTHPSSSAAPGTPVLNALPIIVSASTTRLPTGVARPLPNSRRSSCNITVDFWNVFLIRYGMVIVIVSTI